MVVVGKQLSSSRAHISGGYRPPCLKRLSNNTGIIPTPCLHSLSSEYLAHHSISIPSVILLTDGTYPSCLSQGPCSLKAVLRALETFTRIHSLEFSSGFFTHEDYEDFKDQDSTKMTLSPAVSFPLEVPGPKSLTLNDDIKKYIMQLESESQLDRRIRFLFNVITGLRTLNFCSLIFPNTP